MKLFYKALGLLLSLASFAVLGVGAYVAIKYIAFQFLATSISFDKDTTMLLVIALLVALIIARSIRQLSKQGKVNQLHSEKAATYRLFVDLCSDLYQVERGSEHSGTAEVFEAAQTLDRLLALYGSPAVIKAHAALRALEQEHGTRDPNVRSQLGKALMEMRKDLGSKTLGLRPQELLDLLLPSSDTLSASSDARGLSRSAALALQPGTLLQRGNGGDSPADVLPSA